jgi:hypothetical protein
MKSQYGVRQYSERIPFTFKNIWKRISVNKSWGPRKPGQRVSVHISLGDFIRAKSLLTSQCSPWNHVTSSNELTWKMEAMYYNSRKEQEWKNMFRRNTRAFRYNAFVSLKFFSVFFWR